MNRPPLSPALVAELRAQDPEYQAAQKRKVTPVHGRLCADCDRPMMSQRIYNADPDMWRAKGFVRHGAEDHCNGCYSARSKGYTPRQQSPRFRASAVRIEPSYPVVCEVCGPVGEPHESREAANRARDAHVRWHRLPESVRARKDSADSGPLPAAELARLRQAVGIA